MNLPVNDPLCRNPAFTYLPNILTDEQSELVAHLLRRVEGHCFGQRRGVIHEAFFGGFSAPLKADRTVAVT